MGPLQSASRTITSIRGIHGSAKTLPGQILFCNRDMKIIDLFFDRHMHFVDNFFHRLMKITDHFLRDMCIL